MFLTDLAYVRSPNAWFIKSNGHVHLSDIQFGGFRPLLAYIDACEMAKIAENQSEATYIRNAADIKVKALIELGFLQRARREIAPDLHEFFHNQSAQERLLLHLMKVREATSMMATSMINDVDVTSFCGAVLRLLSLHK